MTLLKPCFADYVFLFSHKPWPFACWPCSSLPHMAAAPFRLHVLDSFLSRQKKWLCSAAELQDFASGDFSSRCHPLSVLPETCCHQHPVPAAGGNQTTPPHLRVASTEESKERETIIRHQVLEHVQNLHVILPFPQGAGGGGNICFAFISMFGHLTVEAKRPGIPNTTYRRLCALAQCNSNTLM